MTYKLTSTIEKLYGLCVLHESSIYEGFCLDSITVNGDASGVIELLKGDAIVEIPFNDAQSGVRKVANMIGVSPADITDFEVSQDLARICAAVTRNYRGFVERYFRSGKNSKIIFYRHGGTRIEVRSHHGMFGVVEIID